MNRQRARRQWGGLALVVGVGLVPIGVMAYEGEDQGPPRMGGYPAPMGEHGPMPAQRAGIAGDHHMGPGDHHMAREAAHAPMRAHGHVKKDTGVVEGGFGSGDNSGGSIVGADAVPGHGHGDNQGGGIH
jgi:hypothetical protein